MHTLAESYLEAHGSAVLGWTVIIIVGIAILISALWKN
jgi:hypothetical protein